MACFNELIKCPTHGLSVVNSVLIVYVIQQKVLVALAFLIGFRQISGMLFGNQRALARLYERFRSLRTRTHMHRLLRIGIDEAIRRIEAYMILGRKGDSLAVLRIYLHTNEMVVVEGSHLGQREYVFDHIEAGAAPLGVEVCKDKLMLRLGHLQYLVPSASFEVNATVASMGWNAKLLQEKSNQQWECSQSFHVSIH